MQLTAEQIIAIIPSPSVLRGFSEHRTSTTLNNSPASSHQNDTWLAWFPSADRSSICRAQGLSTLLISISLTQAVYTICCIRAVCGTRPDQTHTHTGMSARGTTQINAIISLAALPLSASYIFKPHTHILITTSPSSSHSPNILSLSRSHTTWGWYALYIYAFCECCVDTDAAPHQLSGAFQL